MMTEINQVNYPFYQETYKIIGNCMEVHKVLGHGFMEVVYKDALETEFMKRNLAFVREKEYLIKYKDTTLKHRFYADFVIDDRIVLEAKAREGGLSDECVAQCINYLKVSGCKIALLVNFGKVNLEFKRLIL